MSKRRISLKFLLLVYFIGCLFFHFKLQSLTSSSLPPEILGHTAVDTLNLHGKRIIPGGENLARNETSELFRQQDPPVDRNPARKEAPHSYTRLTRVHSIPTPIVNDNFDYLPLWQKNLQQCQAAACRGDNSSSDQTKQYFLTVVVMCRIYETDKAKWTVRELKQWLHYLFLAGVEHVYYYDEFHYHSERMDIALQKYTQAGIVTYIPWANKPAGIMKVQMMCYQHAIDHYGNLSTWQIAIDMDEYPFSVIDTREGFISRFLENITQTKGSGVTEISMQNYLMMGQGNRSRDLVIDRINRMTPRPANNLVKPIYRPARIKTAAVHHNGFRSGSRMVADSDMLRMAHYWGARTQNWGADTPETIKKTVEMNLVKNSWAEKLRNSLLSWGETDAFATASGP